jgi:phospholipid/cholesterol/gamma-HCH transport system substrate-binding protein
METRANYVAVGAFVLAVLTGIVVAVLWLARTEFSQNFTNYDIYITGAVTGLIKGSPVRYNGIQVGRVTEIRIDPANLRQVRVTIEVDQTTEIRSDAVASIEVQGLTGAGFIEISGGSQEAAPLQRLPGQRYPVIASQPSGLQRLVVSAPEAFARLIDVADRLSALLDEKNRLAIAETLDNLRRLSGVAAGRAGDIDTALGDTAAAMHELRGALASAHQTATELHALIGPGGDARDTLKSITEASRTLNQLASHLDGVVQDNRKPLRDFSQNSLNELSQLLIDTRTLVLSLNRLSDEIQRNPERFFFGGRREGYQPR